MSHRDVNELLHKDKTRMQTIRDLKRERERSKEGDNENNTCAFFSRHLRFRIISIDGNR